MQFYILFFLFTLLCEILGTVGGFGSSVIFVPLAQWVFSFKIVLALTSILHVFSNLSKIGLFWQHIDRRFFLMYGVPSLVFSILGAFLTARVSWAYSELFLGFFLILFSSFFLVFSKIKLPATRTNAVTSGSIAGFLAGFIGTGGAIRGVSMAAFDLEKNVFVATSGAIDFGVDFSRMVIYLNNDFMTPQYWRYVPLLLVASIVGTYIGKWILNRISQATFKTFVLVLILLIGISMIWKVFL